MAKVTFYGACGCVTGSCTLLSWDGGGHQTQILVDCGMYQGEEELEQRNWNRFPFDPHRLDAVVVTHAHLDHTGLLPRLVASGYRGPIHCTGPTRGLMSLVLLDAAELQEEQARYARRKGYSRHAEPKPLYTRQDAREAMRQVRTHDFDHTVELAPGIRLRFRRAGHLLGAATVEIRAKGSDGQQRFWCFSGDVGRYDVPILKDPEPPEETPAALLLESTYGDRTHAKSDPKEELGEIIERTFARGGTVIIPAFALGRSQEVLYYLSELAEAGRVDPRTVFLDSPMAIKATDLYDRAESEHDEELIEMVRDVLDPLSPNEFQYCNTVGQSKALNDRRQPAIIVASSGMAQGGRVVHHLLHHLSRPQDAVVFVGYQASGTRGRALVNGAQSVAFQGRRQQVRAEILQVSGLSAHADCEELLRWCRSLPGAPQRVFLNHGEDPQRKALAAALVEELGWPRPQLPLSGDAVPW